MKAYTYYANRKKKSLMRIEPQVALTESNGFAYVVSVEYGGLDAGMSCGVLVV